jgi:hypothetical protein
MRRKQHVRVIVHGMEGVGTTKTEAKQDAIQKIEKACEGTWSPLLLVAEPYSIIIYRNMDGWCSQSISDERGFRDWSRNGSSFYGNQTRNEVERAVRRHLGDLTMDCETAFAIEDVPAIVENAQDRRDLLRGAAWQRSYKALRAMGYSDFEAHRNASDHIEEHMLQPA